jgi:hypothetical protein
MKICKKTFCQLFYGECYYRHWNKNEKYCPTCKIAEKTNSTDEEKAKLAKHKELLGKQMKAYDFDKSDQKTHQTRLFLVLDFTRLEGNGNNGGETIQDLIIWRYKYDSIKRDFTSQTHHYIPTKLSQKNDAAFVGTVLGDYVDEIRRTERVDRVLIWSDGGGAHFKQKFSMGMMLIKQTELNIKFRWCFFASNHGHNACDGAASLVKRTQRKKYLANDTTQSTPKEFVDFIHKDVAKHQSRLVEVERQRGGATSLSGIRGLHQFWFDSSANVVTASESSLSNVPTHRFPIKKFVVCLKIHASLNFHTNAHTLFDLLL